MPLIIPGGYDPGGEGTPGGASTGGGGSGAIIPTLPGGGHASGSLYGIAPLDPSAPEWARRRRMMMNMPRQAGATGWNPMAQGGMMPQWNAFPQQQGSAPGMLPGMSPQKGGAQRANGFLPMGLGQGQSGPRYEDYLKMSSGPSILANAAGAGAFDPMGSNGLIQMLQQQGISDNGAFQRAAQLHAQLMGGDPSQQAYYQSQAGMQGQDNLQRSLLQARLQSAMMNQQLAHSLAQQRYGAEQGRATQKAGQKGALGGFFGGLIGNAAGAFLPGVGGGGGAGGGQGFQYMSPEEPWRGSWG